jgi:hypothetical protein
VCRVLSQRLRTLGQGGAPAATKAA